MLQIIVYEKGSEMKGVAEVMGKESEESSRIWTIRQYDKKDP